MNNNVNAMKYDLTQSEIDRLDDYEYAMFLAYGDTFRSGPQPNLEAVEIGGGSDQLWPDEAARILEDVRDEVLFVGKRLRDSIYNQRTTWGN